MDLSKLHILLLAALFLFGCNTDAISEIAERNDSPSKNVTDDYGEVEGVYANENLDLLAVGDLLNDAADAAEFERLINREDGVNNLDLNGDGNVDYISVEEFDDRTEDQRGFSLFTRFGPDDIQEIASIIFGRDRPDRRGATLYIKGNEQIYGDNYYYEGNWLDKSLAIAGWVFGARDGYYRSPYYHDNYPDYYRVYRVIGTPSYRQRFAKIHVNPAMIKITTPTMKIKIKSPYPGRSYRRAHAKMVKPTKAQLIFFKNRPNKPDFRKDDDAPPGSDKATKGKGKKGHGKDTDKGPKQNGKTDAGRNPGRPERKNSGKPPVQKGTDKGSGKPAKGPKNKGGGKGKGNGAGPGKS